MIVVSGIAANGDPDARAELLDQLSEMLRVAIAKSFEIDRISNRSLSPRLKRVVAFRYLTSLSPRQRVRTRNKDSPQARCEWNRTGSHVGHQLPLG